MISGLTIRISSLRKIVSPALSSPQLPVALCLGLSPSEISPFHVPISLGIDIVQALFRQ